MSNYLIPLFPRDLNGQTVNTVNARDLHAFLGSKRNFTTWIKHKIRKYNFEKGNDFIVIDKVVTQVSGAKRLTEYHLSLDMAKELSMVENTERGREARKYFIQCEKALLPALEELRAFREFRLVERLSYTSGSLQKARKRLEQIIRLTKAQDAGLIFQKEAARLIKMDRSTLREYQVELRKLDTPLLTQEV